MESDSANQRLALQLVEELVDEDEETRSRRLDELRSEQPVVHALVVRLLGAEEPVEDFLEPPDAATAVDEEPPVRDEEVIGGYRLIRRIDFGGMGEVFLAEQSRPKRLVALKTLHARLNEHAERRFELESFILGRLHHPAIAEVYEAGIHETADGERIPFFAMEYVEEGKRVTEAVRDRGLDLRARIRLFLDVCEAIHHGHMRGVIHRDLKPSNVLVDKHGDARVIDFGVASLREDTTELMELTAQGQVVGTLAYLPPEAFTPNADTHDPRRDVYALGLILYELLTDTEPFDRDRSPLAQFQPSAANDLPPPSARNEEVPEDLDWVVMRAAEGDLSARFPSVGELRDDLQRWLQGLPVQSGPPAFWYRARKLVRRHPVRATVLAALFLLVTAVTITGTQAALAKGQVRERDRLLDDLILLAEDVELADELEERAWELRPDPAHVAEFDAWLERWSDLQAREPDHHATAGDLGSLASSSGGRLPFLIQSILERLETLELAEAEQWMSSRREFAATVKSKSLASPSAAAAWELASRSIANAEECPLYGGLEVRPQLGLLPLQRNEQGLWEFLHIASGSAPARDETGGVRMSAESGVVLVLLPGGSFSMGNLQTQGDDELVADELPVQEQSVAPFFLSKFELTAAQWARGVHGNTGEASDSTRPAAGMTWREAFRVVGVLGLDLPTECQWEFAARAGTTSIWWWGDEEPRGHEAWNERDPLIMRVQSVGTRPANPFGLHDMHGNVSEWCQDPYSATYSEPGWTWRDRSGEHVPPVPVPDRVSRGGWCIPIDVESDNLNMVLRQVRMITRSSFRAPADPKSTVPVRGLRPARTLDS